MTKTILQTLKGFRDFLPADARLRAFVKDVFTSVFENYGFAPLETPTLEYSSTLLNKYGDEADKLVYRFRDNGDRDVAMRYDLTVPTAKVMAMYQSQIKLPFKRYQIGNVWRGDNPQSGRYREFTQCDVDIFGPISPEADAEILVVVAKVLMRLGIVDFTIQVNSRKTLNLILETSGIVDNKNSILQTIDKLDKLSYDGVQIELKDKGLTGEQINKLFASLQSSLPDPELQKTIDYFLRNGLESKNIKYNPAIVRGLDYYTGMIFETTVNGVNIGSVASGGRYDNLIASLGGPDISAVGVGMGFDRIVEVVKELKIDPSQTTPIKVLIANFDSYLMPDYQSLQEELQQANIPCFIFPQNTKLDKQIRYALDLGIPYLLIQGSDEKKENKWLLKNLPLKTQVLVEKSDLFLL